VDGLAFGSECVNQEAEAGSCSEAKGSKKHGENAESGEQCIDWQAGILHARSCHGENHVDLGKNEACNRTVPDQMILGCRWVHGLLED
jgi:hypothetical protein